jgi:rRNA biogenesis protein RRP5
LKLWGAVVEIMPRELIVSLPHGLRGHVAYREASEVLAELAAEAAAAHAAAAAAEPGGAPPAKPAKRKAAGGAAGPRALPPLAELFAVGQLVRCTVVGLRGGEGDPGPAPPGGGPRRKRVDLSLHVARANAGLGAGALRAGAALPGCVRSVEDHGYLLTLGIKGTSAFLPKSAAPPGGAATLTLAPGALVEVVVEEVKAGGAAIVTADPAAVAAAATKEWEGLNIDTLVPGALVSARVRNVLSDGLLLSFLTFFTGTVDPFHLGAAAGAGAAPAAWAKAFAPNQRLRARILYVDAAAKRVGLSLQRHLLDAALPSTFPLMGQVFEAAEVRRVDPGLGLLLDLDPLPGSKPLAPGYAHLSALSDDRLASVEAKFRAGQVVRARVVGFRPVDGLAVVSLKPSVVDQSLLSVADVAPGARVGGTVVRSDEAGVVVQLAPGVRAHVPPAHVSDVASAKAHRKFKEGQRVAGRVLQVDPARKRVTLTLKQTLVDSKLAAIADAGAAVAGARAHGTVTGVQDYGVFLSFFGGVSGLASLAECGLPEGQKPRDAFAVGQGAQRNSRPGAVFVFLEKKGLHCWRCAVR